MDLFKNRINFLVRFFGAKTSFEREFFVKFLNFDEFFLQNASDYFLKGCKMRLNLRFER